MIRLVIWIIIGLLALSFFGVSLQALVENPTNQNNMSYLFMLLKDGWDYLVAWLSATFGFLFGWIN